MKIRTRFAVAAAALGAAVVPAAAQTPVAVSAFDSVELRGGGTVTVRHGNRQSVTLLSGDLETSRFSVDDQGRLNITACRRSCRDYRLRVEIVTPDIDALAIHGGGSIRTEGAFPSSNQLAVAISGGGSIDAEAIESSNVAASIRGGGSIRTHARASLAASINGGGSIRYRGDPSVTTAINGGGTVSPAR
jgi:hypothetical protein